MATEALSPVQWLSWSQFHVPNPLMKSYSRLSTWCLRLNTLGLKSTNHVFPKPPDLPVSEAKLPFSFSLIPKPQSLLANFSFPSCLKLSLPPILQSSQILLHTSIHLFSSSATIFSQAQLRHLCTEGVVTSWVFPVIPPLMIPQLTTKQTCFDPVIPPLKPREGSYQVQSFKPVIQGLLSSCPNLPFNPYILLLCNTNLASSSPDILTILLSHLVLLISTLWQNLFSHISFPLHKYHILLKLWWLGSYSGLGFKWHLTHSLLHYCLCSYLVSSTGLKALSCTSIYTPHLLAHIKY